MLTKLMSEHKIIESKKRGDLLVTANSQYNHLDADNVTVEENITVRLFGTISGKLIIKQGARVFLHGSAEKVENSGGELYQF